MVGSKLEEEMLVNLDLEVEMVFCSLLQLEMVVAWLMEEEDEVLEGENVEDQQPR